MTDARPIIRAYNNGMPLDMVAKQFGMSLHKVLDIVWTFRVGGVRDGK